MGIMRLDDIEPITTLKRDTARVFERSRERNGPIAITQNGKVTGVVCDVDVYQRQQQALAMLKLIAQSDDAISKGDVLPHAQAIQELEQLLNVKPEQ